MPEIRGQAVMRSYAYRPRVAEYGVLRSISTEAARRTPVLSAEDMKENIPPKWCPKVPAKRSPLPAWYPRRPLSDITAIINAMERRRAELQAARHQVNNGVHVSPGGGSSPVSVLEQQEPSTPEPSSSSGPQSAASINPTSSTSKSPPSLVMPTFESTNKAVVCPGDSDNKEVIEERAADAAEVTPDNKEVIKERAADAAEITPDNKEVVIEERAADAAEVTPGLNSKKKLEELELAVEEHLKSMPKVTVERRRRSTLLSLR